MYINRMTINVKPGHMEDVLALLKENREQTGSNQRIYEIYIGKYDQISLEIEAEDMAGYEKGWAEWSARPETPAFREKWLEYTDGGFEEIWRLVE